MKSRSSPAARSRATGRATRTRPTSPAYDASSPVRSVAAVHEVAHGPVSAVRPPWRTHRPTTHSPATTTAATRSVARGVARSAWTGRGRTVAKLRRGGRGGRLLAVAALERSVHDLVDLGLEGRDLLVGVGLGLRAGRDLVLLVLGVGRDEGVGHLGQIHALGLGQVGEALAAGQRGAQLVRRHPEGGGRLVEAEALAGTAWPAAEPAVGAVGRPGGLDGGDDRVGLLLGDGAVLDERSQDRLEASGPVLARRLLRPARAVG